MATFLFGNKLNSEIEEIIENAQNLIILISPYIKLHERYVSVLKTKIDQPNVQLLIVFGKNEDDISKSMIEEDFNFFKDFPNVKIYYEKRLHAKYVANESSSIITSMNFHKYSMDNNIEVGVKAEQGSFIGSKLGSGDSKFDSEAWDYFRRVIDQADLLFKKEPQFKTGMLGLTKTYINSITEVDKLSEFFSNKNTKTTKTSSQGKSFETENEKKESKTISTSQISKQYNIPAAKITQFMAVKGFIADNQITTLGKQKGLVMKSYLGKDYIAYPENLEEFKDLKYFG